jgi:hypothetical protein
MLRWIVRMAALLAVAMLAGGVVAPAVAASSKTLPIDADLRANAEVLKVNLGTGTPAHPINYRFGGYQVVSSKVSEGERWVTSEFMNSVAHVRERNRLWFELQGPESATATTKAEWNILSERPGNCLEIEVGRIKGIEYCLSGGFPEEGANDVIVASIRVNGDAGGRWTLLLNVVRNVYGVRDQTLTSTVTDGTREIAIHPLTTGGLVMGDVDYSARGYEFVEAGRSIGAVQYYGGGALGLDKNTVYLRRDLDPQTKLVLASAMTAIVHIKFDVFTDDTH